LMGPAEASPEVWEEEIVTVTARWYGNVNFFMGITVGFFVGSLFTWVVLYFGG